MRFRLVLQMILCVIVSGMTSAAGSGSQTNSNNQLAHADALRLMRLINTTQGEYILKYQTYVSLDKLVQHPSFRRVQSVIRMADSNSARVKDHSLVVVASEDGKHYQVTLVPESGCEIAMFSNESGLLYQGKVIDCTP